MLFSERRARNYVRRCCEQATASDKGALYECPVKNPKIVAQAEELMPDTHVMLVVSDMKGTPVMCTVGINEKIAWQCLLTGVRGLCMGGIMDASPATIASLDALHSTLSDEGGVLVSAHAFLSAPLSDDELRELRCLKNPPEDIADRIRRRSVMPA